MKRTIGHTPRVLTNQRREKSLAKKRPLIFFMVYRNLITRGFSYLVRVTVCWRRTLIAGSLGGEHPSTFGFHQGSKSRLRTQTREKCAITRTASAARSCCRRQTISCPGLFNYCLLSVEAREDGRKVAPKGRQNDQCRGSGF